MQIVGGIKPKGGFVVQPRRWSSSCSMDFVPILGRPESFRSRQPQRVADLDVGPTRSPVR